MRLIITGFPRSGTSFLAKFITTMGYDTGGSWDDSIRAGMEDKEVGEINHTLFSRFINNLGKEITEGERKDIAEKIRKVREEHTVIKQPRFLTHPDIIKFWHDVTPGFKVVCLSRFPEDVIKSIRKVGKTPRWNEYEMRCQYHDFLQQLRLLDIDFRTLQFPQFLNQYDKVYTIFNELGIQFDKRKGRKVWKEIVDFGKVSFK